MVPGHAATLRSLLAAAFGDPALEVAFPRNGGWVGAD